MQLKVSKGLFSLLHRAVKCLVQNAFLPLSLDPFLNAEGHF